TPGQPSLISDDPEAVTLTGSSQEAANRINQKEIHWGQWQKTNPLPWELMTFRMWWILTDLTIIIIYNGHNMFISLLKDIRRGDPLKDDPMFKGWDDEDSFMTWLWNSMTQEISQNYMFYSCVREI
ncbi:Transcription initiation factor TFIID subunit 5, partial [Mucuna pruriens]